MYSRNEDNREMFLTAVKDYVNSVSELKDITLCAKLCADEVVETADVLICATNSSTEVQFPLSSLPLSLCVCVCVCVMCSCV